MVATKPHIDEAAISFLEFHEDLESQAQEIAPDASFDYIRPAFRAFAQKTACEIDRAARIELEQQLEIGRKLLEARETLTKRKEYTKFREEFNLTSAEARKRMKLAEIFGDWDIERLVVISGATSLFALCQAKYAEVVSRLREVPQIAKDFVKRQMLEARAAHALMKPKLQKQQKSGAVLSKHVDEETGTFYYTLEEVNLSYATGSALAAKLETYTIGQVIAEAVEARDNYVTNQPQEFESVVADLRRALAENRELKFQLEQSDIRIAELETQLLNSAPLHRNNNSQPENMQFSTWEEAATAFETDRSKLLSTVKKWSTEERQNLSKLLSEFLEASPERLEQVFWLPENLLKSALQYLFFTVQKIVGSNNLIDEPLVEYIRGCRLVSLRDFGTLQEHWVFRSPDGKQFPVYGRSEFSIERPS